jgi:hypothetical protein
VNLIMGGGWHCISIQVSVPRHVHHQNLLPVMNSVHLGHACLGAEERRTVALSSQPAGSGQ